MALEANYLRVRLDHPGPDGRRLLLCTRRARLAHGGLKVMVGDRVGVEGCDWGEGRAAVGSLEPRRNQLQRPALANVDQVLVVMALAQPAIDPESLSRFLLSAETAGAAKDGENVTPPTTETRSAVFLVFRSGAFGVFSLRKKAFSRSGP